MLLRWACWTSTSNHPYAIGVYDNVVDAARARVAGPLVPVDPEQFTPHLLYGNLICQHERSFPRLAMMLSGCR